VTRAQCCDRDRGRDRRLAPLPPGHAARSRHLGCGQADPDDRQQPVPGSGRERHPGRCQQAGRHYTGCRDGQHRAFGGCCRNLRPRIAVCARRGLRLYRPCGAPRSPSGVRLGVRSGGLGNQAKRYLRPAQVPGDRVRRRPEGDATHRMKSWSCRGTVRPPGSEGACGDRQTPGSCHRGSRHRQRSWRCHGPQRSGVRVGPSRGDPGPATRCDRTRDEEPSAHRHPQMRRGGCAAGRHRTRLSRHRMRFAGHRCGCPGRPGPHRQRTAGRVRNLSSRSSARYLSWPRLGSTPWRWILARPSTSSGFRRPFCRRSLRDPSALRIPQPPSPTSKP
jgi:hypothetical protein